MWYKPPFLTTAPVLTSTTVALPCFSSKLCAFGPRPKPTSFSVVSDGRMRAGRIEDGNGEIIVSKNHIQLYLCSRMQRFSALLDSISGSYFRVVYNLSYMSAIICSLINTRVKKWAWHVKPHADKRLVCAVLPKRMKKGRNSTMPL